jgi:hypothetical protein
MASSTKSSALDKAREIVAELEGLADGFNAQIDEAVAVIVPFSEQKQYRKDTKEWLEDLGADLNRAAVYGKQALATIETRAKAAAKPKAKPRKPGTKAHKAGETDARKVNS